jgi:hypothetical protein
MRSDCLPPPAPDALLGAPPPLVHARTDDVDALKQEQSDHLARWPALQVMAEALIALRAAGAPWWESAALGVRWPLSERLQWLEQRPDLREDVTRRLTGLTLREGRGRSVAFQAELIDAVAEPRIDARRIEEAFDPRDLATYAPVGELWDEMMRRIPWDAEIPPALVEQLLGILLAERSTLLGATRSPVLSAWKLRAAIDTRAWQAHVPSRVRAAVDEARLHKELVEPGAPFTARDELAIATPAVLASNLPLRALRPVFVAAARVLGFEVPAPAYSRPAPKGEHGEPANDCDATQEDRDADAEVTVSTA